ncbi:MAG: hypothetical protein RBT49_17030 [Bacteroidales bacterium]|jgi:hypothetical protein|nr:hypothetical protein [Bacteroidales bacterium]
MKKKAQEVVQEVFYNMSKMYESIFTSYYPSHGSNGFTERNLTFYFSHFYLKNANNLSDIIIWQEVPIQGGEHFDTLIIDTVNEMFFIIEAKRLQNKGKFESIKDDFEKIIQKNNQIKIPHEFTLFDKYAILLTDIWVPENNNKIKKDIRDNFIDFKSELNIEKSIEKHTIKIENINNYNHSKEEYWIMYNLYEIV